MATNTIWNRFLSGLGINRSIPAPSLDSVPGSARPRRNLNESVLTNDFWMSSYIDMMDRFRDGGGQSYPISNPQDRKYGSNYPFWYSEQQLSLIRAQARLVTTTNPNALGLLNGLCSYVIGSGFSYRAIPKGTVDIDESTVRRCQEVLERFISENEWEIMEQEIFSRSRSDGEAFIRLFPQSSGRLVIRTIEPEQVYMPPGESMDNWSYGINTDPDDSFNVLNYYVDYLAPKGESSEHDKTRFASPSGEIVGADRVIHIKCNVPKSIKRGLSDFSYETLDMFSLAGKLRKNLGEAASVQSAIAAIRQHDTATSAQVETFVDNNIDFSATSSPNNRQTDYQRIEPGSFLDIPKGMNYVQPPGAEFAKDHLDIFQALLRSAGNRHNAPEWLSSANTAGANYASSLTAESPFLRNCIRMQTFYKRYFTRIAREAVRTAAEYGELPINILDVIDIIVTPPAVEARDKIADSQANQTYVTMGIKSAQTVTQELGLDFDQEQRNIEQQADKMASDLPPGEDSQSQVSDSALNGLQIENLVGIVMRAASGQISIEVARAIAKAAFPLMPDEQITAIFPDSLAGTREIPARSKAAPKEVKTSPTGVSNDPADPADPTAPSEGMEVSPVAESKSINFKPPASVRSAAKRGLKLRAKYNRGGTAIGVARARDLMNGANLSPSTIKRMTSYFARHEVDKKGEGWGEDSAGYIAWLLWGGDAGWSWARKISAQIDRNK